jgi:hypothetical protein
MTQQWWPDNNETAYKEEVRDLAVWFQDNNLSH